MADRRGAIQAAAVRQSPWTSTTRRGRALRQVRRAGRTASASYGLWATTTSGRNRRISKAATIGSSDQNMPVERWPMGQTAPAGETDYLEPQ